MRINRTDKKSIIIGVTTLFIVSASFFLWEKGLFDGLYKEKKITIRATDATEISDIPRKGGNSAENDVLKDEKENADAISAAQEEKENLEIVLGEKEEKKSGVSLVKIITNSVNWGYEVSVSRKISAIIIHSSYDALGNDPYDFTGLLAEYKNYGVSPHYVIDRGGKIYQLVADKNIAYHAGKSRLPNGETDVNGVSLGIELMNTEKDSYTAKQYQSLKELLAKLKKNYPIEYVLGHKDIAPGRKTDPWNFDWNKL